MCKSLLGTVPEFHLSSAPLMFQCAPTYNKYIQYIQYLPVPMIFLYNHLNTYPTRKWYVSIVQQILPQTTIWQAQSICYWLREVCSYCMISFCIISKFCTFPLCHQNSSLTLQLLVSEITLAVKLKLIHVSVSCEVVPSR